MRLIFITLLVSLLVTPCLFAQQNFTITLQWNKTTSITYNEKNWEIPIIEGLDFNGGGVPSFSFRENIKFEGDSIGIVNVLYESASEKDRELIKGLGIQVPYQFNPNIGCTKERGKPALVGTFHPYLMVNNQLQRIVSVTIQVFPKQTGQLMLKEFVSNSVLVAGSGEWYKIEVSKDGIYKIDRAFLLSCGIDVDNLNPTHLNIFGNGDGKLPEINGSPKTDDLALNRIFISGEGDGSFDEQDYILFYGWGPSRWSKKAGNLFEQDKNIYSDQSFYFINVDPSKSPARILSIDGNTLLEDTTTTSYSYYDIHENDLTNLVSGGQRWYGELFDTELEKTFSFNIPNILIGSTVFFETAIATNSSSSFGTEQRYSVNGNVLLTETLPSVSSDYIRSPESFSFLASGATIPLKINITRNSANTLVYLDRILLNTRRNLSFMGGQFNFRDAVTVGPGKKTKFVVANCPANGFVWDVTERHQPKIISGNQSGSNFTFVAETDTLREFVASNGVNFYSPSFKGLVTPQNLHGLPFADMLIVSHKDFLVQAQRLSDLHQTEGLSVHVVSTEQIFNEFSSGMLDPTAIRLFAKMFFDRANGDSSKMPKYLLLFGDGTFDPKNRVSNNNNFVPTYQMTNGENHISALVTDDYYGMLDNGEGISPVDLLDIGVGRLLISDLTTAKQQVDKIEHYMKNGSDLFPGASGSSCSVPGQQKTFGDWRLNYVQIADDEEGGYFINEDTEDQFQYVRTNHPEMNCDKLYLDAFNQVSTAGGQRYPDVQEAITNWVQRGALVMNYVGHGGEVGLAEERVVTVPQIQLWNNINKLNLFVSATCEFTKYDDPSRVSAGEWVSLNPQGGAIALMTTTRSVFFGVNTITGQRFFETVFTRDGNMQPLTFGEIVRKTKNAAGASDNKRSFTLIGDPALRIALPRLNIVTDSINGKNPELVTDTMRALGKITIKGHLEDQFGNNLSSFDGVLAASIFDKFKTFYTLDQDPASDVIPFELQRNIIYKGQATVNDGSFSFSFIVPKDINYTFGPGKISYYANNSSTDAGGQDQRFMVGGVDSIGITDQKGPDIELFLNDEQFVNGGITDESPVLIAHLFDENGINTVGNGIGHDIVALVDNESSNPLVLNEFYTANLDTYQSGKVRYTLPTLSVGKHTLTMKAWDVANNSATSTIEFVVKEKEELSLDHVLNYPNPFTTQTQFFFEHNQACIQLDVLLQIFTVSGKLVKTIDRSVAMEGFRSSGIEWDGRDEFGDQLAKGVYVYRIKVRNELGEIAEKTEKLVLLK
jgi:hypothetical protein